MTTRSEGSGPGVRAAGLPAQRARTGAIGRVGVNRIEPDDDLDALNAGNPLWPGADFVRNRVTTMPPGTAVALFAGALDGRRCGYAAAVCVGGYPGGYAIGSVWVEAAARDAGVGGSLHDAVLATVREAGLPGVGFQVSDDDDRSLAVARGWGCSPHGQHFESVLELGGLSDATVEAALSSLEQHGVELRPLALEDASEEEWRAAYDFLADRFNEAPDCDEESHRLPYGLFRGFVSLPWWVLQARCGERVVGVTAVTAHKEDHALHTWFTGVEPHHRGLGISTALKAVHARMMREHGYRRLFTENMEVNAPILAANERLGFRRLRGYYVLLAPITGVTD